MLMKNKGFTLVELITTFSLTAVIIVLLMNVIIIMKNTYSKTGIKTDLYINQSNLSNTLNSKLNSDNIDSYTPCDDSEFCFTFNLVDGSNLKLEVTEKSVKFDKYVYNLDDNTKIVNPTLKVEQMDEIDKFLIIKIPIVSQMYPNMDFGVNLVYLF